MKVIFAHCAFENLGIEYLSAVLKLHRHSVRLVFDPALFDDPFIKNKYLHRFFDYEKILIKQIVDNDPGIVAFSVLAANYLWALRIAKQVKERLPSVHIVFGGIHPTSVPERVLENEFIDSVIIGEGEFPLLELADSLERKKIDYSIKNIWFRHDGIIIKNELRPYITDLDSLPFPDKELYHEIMPEYRSGYTTITRRGCTNSCSYCHNVIWQMRYPNQERIRFRGVDNVIRELVAAQKRYSFKRLRINDDLFTYNENWLRDFSKEYKKYINIPVYCFTSSSNINENIMGYLKDIRCYQVCLGVQNINPYLREKVLNRIENNDKIKQAIALCRKNKIRCTADNIFGLPEEKEEDIIESAKFYNKNRPNRICIYWLIYFPRTPIIDAALKEGIFSSDFVDSIEKNPCDTASTLQNRIHAKDKIKYHWLLLILHFCPPKIYEVFINKKLYRFLPSFSPAVCEVLFTMLAKDRLDISRRRFYIRYVHYIKEIIRNKINYNLSKIFED